MDVLGTIIVPVVFLMLHTGVIIGWAKPVPVNTRNFNKIKRDMALVALAGPTANFVMALMWAAIAKLCVMLPALWLDFPKALALMGGAGISINIMLMVFNLLPIPPLDGSHIFINLLPRSIAIRYERIAPYGIYILLILLYLGVVSFIIGPIIEILCQGIVAVFRLPL
jgi:Zn-dependent protease